MPCGPLNCRDGFTRRQPIAILLSSRPSSPPDTGLGDGTTRSPSPPAISNTACHRQIVTHPVKRSMQRVRR
ncbi:hypothetical protein KCP75_02570 [Salmonella enterica subsp. enterica]|nr:hypothetical protein KCP75_02570 [Salmonella enterica subsp. enterica]